VIGTIQHIYNSITLSAIITFSIFLFSFKDFIFSKIIKYLFQTFAKSRELGIFLSLKFLFIKIYDIYWEKRLEVKTGGNYYLSNQTLVQNYHDYMPARYWELTHSLKLIPLDFKKVTFIDIGSGKGKMLIMAAMFSFKKVIGVELCKNLTELAIINYRKAQSKLRCKNIEFITCNAIDYSIPDEAGIIFLFNPFSGPILSKVLDNIKQSLLRKHRILYIIFINVSYAEHVLNSISWLSIFHEFHGSYHNAIYRAAL
jgi:precorrin-6B methylase 2